MDPRNFIYTSDYELPLFVWKIYGSFVAPAGDTWYKFEHGLPFTPLLTSIIKRSYPYPNPTQYPRDIDEVYADDTNVYFRVSSPNYDSLVEYKIWGYAPPDYDDDIIPTEGGGLFNIDTDYNHLQIYMAGKCEYEIAPGPKIAHNLGYCPLARIWKYVSAPASLPYTNNDLLRPWFSSDIDNSQSYPNTLVVDSNYLYIGEVKNGTVAYYHIYTNEG